MVVFGGWIGSVVIDSVRLLKDNPLPGGGVFFQRTDGSVTLSSQGEQEEGTAIASEVDMCFRA